MADEMTAVEGKWRKKARPLHFAGTLRRVR